jgi:D-aminoacyl-tRNA deacylase
MRVLLQRVSSASVTVETQVVGNIARGFVLLVGVGPEDTVQDTEMLAQKIGKLRIFSDENGKMNLSLEQVSGQILSISQFTLFANTTGGNRPSFTGAAKAELGNALWNAFNMALEGLGFVVQKGVFGADMQVALVNDGPVTLWLDSKSDSRG